MHSTILASASPYFKARCWTDSAEGRLQYADAVPAAEPSGDGKRKHDEAFAQPAGPVLLVELVEEGELLAMEAVLRHCYTEELFDSGRDASELSVATLMQILALANRYGGDMEGLGQGAQEVLWLVL